MARGVSGDGFGGVKRVLARIGGIRWESGLKNSKGAPPGGAPFQELQADRETAFLEFLEDCVPLCGGIGGECGKKEGGGAVGDHDLDFFAEYRLDLLEPERVAKGGGHGMGWRPEDAALHDALFVADPLDLEGRKIGCGIGAGLLEERLPVGAEFLELGKRERQIAVGGAPPGHPLGLLSARDGTGDGIFMGAAFQPDPPLGGGDGDGYLLPSGGQGRLWAGTRFRGDRRGRGSVGGG